MFYFKTSSAIIHTYDGCQWLLTLYNLHCQNRPETNSISVTVFIMSFFLLRLILVIQIVFVHVLCTDSK